MVRFLRSAAAGVLGALLAAGMMSPPAGARAATSPPPDAGGRGGPVTRIALTGSDGARTPVARDGIPAARAGQASQPVVRSRPLSTAEFAVAAVTWDAGEEWPEEARIHLRVREADGWSEWLEADPDEARADGRAEGTDPFVTGGATGVQVRVSGPSQGLPAGMALMLVPADSTADEVTVTDPPELPEPPDPSATQAPRGGGGAVGTTGRLVVPSAVPARVIAPGTVDVPDVGEIVTREEWGADEEYTTENWRPRYAPLEAAVVHHTAGTNTYTEEESAAIVKAIYRYHTLTRGWGDIGYNFLVDRFGRVFEGRQNSIQSQPGVPTGWLIEAGHALAYNRGSLGLSAMGDFTLETAPETEQISAAMARVIAWKFKEANLDSTVDSRFTAPRTSTFPTYEPGAPLPRIFGHGDVAATSCPGALYNDLDGIRKAVAEGYTRAEDTTPPTVDAAVLRDGLVELVATDDVDENPVIIRTLDGAAPFYSPVHEEYEDIPDTRYLEPFSLGYAAMPISVAVDSSGNTSAPVVHELAPRCAREEPPADLETTPEVSRCSGSDRYEVAVAVSASTFRYGASVAYVANGLAPADALAAGPVAGMTEGPVLLTKSDRTPAAVMAELRRLRPERIVVLGGTGSVTAEVEELLATVAPTTRWAGADRYEVAANVSEVNFPDGSSVAFVANGLATADALTAGPVAAPAGGPMLLVRATGIPPAVADEVRRLDPDRIVVLGGTGSVSAEVEEQLGEIAPTSRWGGIDRYLVSVNVSLANFPDGAATVHLANGLAFADALAGGPAAAMAAGPILLVRSDSVPPSVLEEIDRLAPARVVILGGAGSVSSDVAAQVVR